MSAESQGAPSGEASSDAQLGTVMHHVKGLVASIVASQEALAQLHERSLRRELRWKNIRTALVAFTLLLTAVSYGFGMQSLVSPPKMRGPYAALVRLDGLIDANQKANAEKINAALRSAFEDPQARGVIVLINSPGGSPVQASLIHDRLLGLRQRFPRKPVWVIGEDMLTSGAYYVAVAAERVCVNPNTMTGSIGVIMSGWGLDRAIEHLGIDRRVFAAGSHKSRLDSFRPLTLDDQRKAKALLDAIHAQFIEAVRSGRGGRLKGDPAVLYSGDYWTGEEAVKLGLVDGLCDLDSLMEHEFGVREFRDYTSPPSLWTSLSNSFGVALDQLAPSMVSAIAPRLLP